MAAADEEVRALRSRRASGSWQFGPTSRNEHAFVRRQAQPLEIPQLPFRDPLYNDQWYLVSTLNHISLPVFFVVDGMKRDLYRSVMLWADMT